MNCVDLVFARRKEMAARKCIGTDVAEAGSHGACHGLGQRAGVRSLERVTAGAEVRHQPECPRTSCLISSKRAREGTMVSFMQ